MFLLRSSIFVSGLTKASVHPHTPLWITLPPPSPLDHFVKLAGFKIPLY